MTVRASNLRQKKPVAPAVISNGQARVANALDIQAEAERLNQFNELQRENEKLQDQLDKVADLASAPADPAAADSLTEDDLKDKLNAILDVAAPGEADDSEDDEEDDED